MRRIPILALFILLLTCSKEDNLPAEQSNSEVADNVLILRENNTDVISTEEEILNGIYKIEFTGNPPQVALNDIIVGEQGNGYLRRVTGVGIDDNVLTLQTSQATLDDVFNDVSIAFNTDISPNSSSRSTEYYNLEVNYMAEGVNMSDDGFQFDFSDTVLYQEGNATFKISEGLVTFKPNFSFDADYSVITGLDYLEFKTNDAELSINCELDFTFAQEFNIPTFERTLINFDKKFLVLVAGVPVVVVVNTELVAKLNASAQANVTNTFNWSKRFGVTTGVKYENDNWNGIYDASSNFTINSITFGGQTNITQNLTVTPRVSVEFYDVIGPYCEPEMTEDFFFNIASPSLDWDSNVKVGLDLTTGVDVNVFGNTLVDFSTTDSFEREIWNAPANLLIESGNNQTGVQNQALPQALKVKVTDAIDNPLPFVPVYFNVMQGDGTLTNGSFLTDENGIAEDFWILGEGGINQQVEVIVKKADGSNVEGARVVFSATANQPSETSISITGDLNFGEIFVNETSQPKTLSISNPNTVPITVSSLVFPEGFESISQWSSGVIQPNESQQIEVVFSPTEAIDYQGSITVENNSDADDNTIAVTGTGIEQPASISLSGDLNFGNVEVNTTLTRTLSINNESAVPLEVTSITLPNDFASNWNNGTIDPNSTFEVEISFTPTEPVNYNGNLVVNNNLDAENNTIQVTGQGILPQGSINVTGNLDFGEVIVNQSSTQSFTIQNTGSVNVQVSGLDIPSGYDTDWTSGIIAVGQSQLVNVTFTPIDIVEYSGEITVLSTAEPVNNSIVVTGLGIDDETITLSGDLEFGDVEINTSIERTLSITNNSVNSVNVSSIDLPEGYSADWTSGAIQSFETKEVTITFNPTDVEVFNGFVTVNNDLDDENNVYPITGEGVVLDFVYPQEGAYGLNVLDVDNGGFGGATYSLHALIPKDKNLRVRITGSFVLVTNNPNADDWTWDISGGGANVTAEMNATKDGKVDFSLLINPAGVTIEVFEDGATDPTFTNN